jgi:hypothetical protein
MARNYIDEDFEPVPKQAEYVRHTYGDVETETCETNRNLLECHFKIPLEGYL